MQGMPGDGRYVGSSAIVPRVRSRRLLRFFQEQACDQALSSSQASHHSVVRVRRGLALVLRRRGRGVVLSLPGSAQPQIARYTDMSEAKAILDPSEIWPEL